MTTEIVWLGHDNTIDLLLKADGVATGASWTNGSATVDDVVGIVLAGNYHLNEYIIGPDSQRYQIIACPISGNPDAFTLDRNYEGGTVSGSDGAFRIDVKAPVDLSAVTKITASFGSTLISSTDKVAGLITWDQPGYDTGEIRIDAGGETITAAGYDVPIITYDPSNAGGVVWGEVSMLVKADVEASP